MAESGSRYTAAPRGDSRAVVPVVGKALEAAIAVLFIGLLTTVLFAGVVPDHRAAVGDELADRTVATAADQIEVTASVPPAAVDVDHRARIDVPRSIQRDPYRLRYVENGTLGTGTNATGPVVVLDHPADRLERRIPLSLPESVNASGECNSASDCFVRASREDGGDVVVELTNGGESNEN
ncbi:hypothetical protein ACFQJC_13340 [Haloferax namakaokahaiae]|uniref:Uncharacterized protein n=1 Tax=Haloferax namakaokahaiae TaxID=1748331 RepID=A0ABD5ZHS2_9EURY